MIKIALTIYNDFKQGLFIRFWLEKGAVLTLNYQTSDIC